MSSHSFAKDVRIRDEEHAASISSGRCVLKKDSLDVCPVENAKRAEAEEQRVETASFRRFSLAFYLEKFVK